VGQLIGKFRPQGGHVAYEYDVTWQRRPAGFVWSATVTTAGTLVSRPSGVARLNAPGIAEAFLTPESGVRRAVESSITQLAIKAGCASEGAGD